MIGTLTQSCCRMGSGTFLVKIGGGIPMNEPKLVGGFGEKKSNGGTQWYQQDRIYDDNVAISVTTSFNPSWICSICFFILFFIS